MSERSDATLWAITQRVGRGSDKLILAALASFTDNKNHAWPSQSTLAVTAEIDVKTVSIGLRRLEAKGFIKQVGTIGQGAKIWSLNLDAPPETGELPPPKTGDEVHDPIVTLKEEGGTGETQGTLLPEPPKPKPAEKPAKPPKNRGTLEDVRALCKSLDLPECDADWFFWKCEGNGWKNSGHPILDWKATIRAWAKGGFFPSQRRNGAGNGAAATTRREQALTSTMQDRLTAKNVKVYGATNEHTQNGHQTAGTTQRGEDTPQVPREIQGGRPLQ